MLWGFVTRWQQQQRQQQQRVPEKKKSVWRPEWPFPGFPGCPHEKHIPFVSSLARLADAFETIGQPSRKQDEDGQFDHAQRNTPLL